MREANAPAPAPIAPPTVPPRPAPIAVAPASSPVLKLSRRPSCTSRTWLAAFTIASWPPEIAASDSAPERAPAVMPARVALRPAADAARAAVVAFAYALTPGIKFIGSARIAPVASDAAAIKPRPPSCQKFGNDRHACCRRLRRCFSSEFAVAASTAELIALTVFRSSQVLSE